MHTLPRTATTEMDVTSIRLERDLKEKLKQFSGNQGYQALIRDILWNYVRQRSSEFGPRLNRADIQASFSATAQQEQRCALTGKVLRPGQAILMGLTMGGDLVTLSTDSLI